MFKLCEQTVRATEYMQTSSCNFLLDSLQILDLKVTNTRTVVQIKNFIVITVCVFYTSTFYTSIKCTCIKYYNILVTLYCTNDLVL